MRGSSRQRGLGCMLLSFMEFLEQKKTAQPQEKDPKDDLLDHWRTQAATIEPKPRRRRRWLAERRTATAKTTARQEASKTAPTESEARDRRAEIRNPRRLPSRARASLPNGANGMSDPSSRILRRGRHGRVRAGWAYDKGRNESARAANEFQIATDLKR